MNLKLKLAWHPPLMMNARKRSVGYDCDCESIPKGQGIYIFARMHGSCLEYLYIGETGNIQSRVKSHFNNLKLMEHIGNAKNGKRYVIYADLKHRKGVDTKAALKIAERALIDFALSQGHALLNKQGTKRKLHTIDSEFPSKYKKTLRPPNVMYAEAR